MANSFYTRTSIASAVIHGLIVVGLITGTLVQGCLYRRHKVERIEFMVAIDDSGEETPDTEPPKEPQRQEPPKPRDPDKPPELPPEKDRVPDKKPPVQKLPDKKPPDPKPPEKKPPEKKPIQKGKRVVKEPTKTPAKQTLTDKEIAEWLKNRARIGERTSLPDSEQARNFAIVHDEIYTAWEQPPQSNAGSLPAIAEFSLAADGRISGAHIIQSSGSPIFDESVLQAIRRVGRISGLNADFLRVYPILSVEFKLGQ
jgi:TonB family protein